MAQTRRCFTQTAIIEWDELSLGTVWTQRIITLIFEEDFPELTDTTTFERMPSLEFRMNEWPSYDTRRSPRLFCSHLREPLMPRGLLRKKAKVRVTLRAHGTHIHLQRVALRVQTRAQKLNGTPATFANTHTHTHTHMHAQTLIHCHSLSLQIIYVSRNPKDAMVSYFHFAKFIKMLEDTEHFNEMLDNFISGRSEWLTDQQGLEEGTLKIFLSLELGLFLSIPSCLFYLLWTSGWRLLVWPR